VRPRVAIAVLLLLPLLAGAGSKKGFTPFRRPNLSVEIASLEPAVASQNCENFAWAAALQTLLTVDHVELGQQYWTDKLSGGGCQDQPFALAELPRAMDGEYTLPTAEGARKARLTTTVVAGVPALLDIVIAGLKSGRPALLVWKQHPYVLTGILYDELIYPNGQTTFELRELRLLDPAAVAKRRVSFVAGVDDGDDIAGLLTIAVTFCETNVIVCR